MSEIKESTDKTLRGDVRKPLSLKRTVARPLTLTVPRTTCT